MRSTAAIFGACLAFTLSMAACSEDEKPSRAEVLAGWQTFMEVTFDEVGLTDVQFDRLGINEEDLQTYQECFVDEIYDDVSDETLEVLATGDLDSRVAEDDHAIVDAANEACLDAAGF